MAKKENNKSKLLQVLIEIGIVTIGILIAYQLNNWKEVRSTRNDEEKMLLEIKANLALDLIDLTNNRNAHSDVLKTIDTIKVIALSNIYDPNIPSFMRDVFRDYMFIAQTSAFETLKAKGVQLIGNDSLRIRILRLYDFNYIALEKIEETYEPHQFTKHYNHIVLNYFDGYDLIKESDIKPIYSGTAWMLKSDIKNRIDLAKNEHRFALELYDPCIAEVKDLIKKIEEEIDNEF